MILAHMAADESTTPDLVELVRGAYEASNRRDFDAMTSVYGRDSVWDMTPMGLGIYEGLAVIRRFFEDWIGTFEEFEVEPDEILTLNGGVRRALRRVRQSHLDHVAGGGAAIGSETVDENDASRWFGEYLKVFEACGRGESDAVSLLAYYGVPLLVATDDAFIALSTEEQVVAAAQQQIDGMRAAAYDRSDVLGSEVTVLNHTSALYRGEFSRRRPDGGEISRLTVTYLFADGSVGRRISALVLHSP